MKLPIARLVIVLAIAWLLAGCATVGGATNNFCDKVLTNMREHLAYGEGHGANNGQHWKRMYDSLRRIPYAPATGGFLPSEVICMGYEMGKKRAETKN